MLKKQNLYKLGIISLLNLSACSNTSDVDNQAITIQKLSSEIEELNEAVSSLQEQLYAPNIIFPIDYNGEQLYVNSRMPFAISLVNSEELPIRVYGYDNSIVVFYENDNINQFLESYVIVPRIIIKENNDNPEYFDSNSIIRFLDDNWAIVRNISIETSLDVETNQKIRTMLENIRFY